MASGRKAATKATPEKEVNERAKATFLAGLADSMTIRRAAECARIDKSTVYRWREADEGFAKAWDEALESGTERLEEEAIRRARDGVDKPVFQGGQQVGAVREFSDTLLIFMLKARRPEVYRDRAAIEHTGKGGKDLVPQATGVLLVPGLAASSEEWAGNSAPTQKA